MLRKLGIITILLGLWSCATPSNIETGGENISDGASSGENLPLVVATTNVLCDLTAQIAQDTVNLKCLMGAGVDPHVYQATPEDRKTIDSADLIFYGGYDFESILIKLLNASSNNNPKIAVFEQAVPNPIMGIHHHHDDKDHDHDHSEEKEEKQPDPHVWHDPNNGIAIVEVIAEGLSQIQPNYSDKYQNRATEIKNELQEINQWITNQIATIPPQQRKLVTTHDSFAYFVTAFDLDSQGALKGISTHESPSAGAVASLVTDIKNSQVPTIFAESSINPQLMETVAREANVQLSPYQLYADGLGEKGSDAQTYQQMLITNTRAIVQGLGGEYTSFNN